MRPSAVIRVPRPRRPVPTSEPQLIESGPLPYLLSVPGGPWEGSSPPPLLCFLHGYDEGAPMPIRPALTAHGPLAPTSAPGATAEFVVLAPQMPTRGDVWHRHADAVLETVRQVQALHRTDPARSYLTGFSFGGNGVFDLALEQRDLWAALWPVDPTRVPAEDPGRPVWLSSGEVSRRYQRAYVQRLLLEPPDGDGAGDRVYVDQRQDHVGTARLAYADDRIYRWLLDRRFPLPPG